MIQMLSVVLVIVLILWIVPLLIHLAKDRSLSRLMYSLCNLITGSLVLVIIYHFREVYLYIGQDGLFIDFIDGIAGVLLLIGAGVLITMLSTYYEDHLLLRFIFFTRMQAMAMTILRMLWLLLYGVSLIEPILVTSIIVLFVTYIVTIPLQKAGQAQL